MSKKSKKNYRDIGQVKEKVMNSASIKRDDFDPDYSYVIKDLKRIGILAGIFFISLIVLSFIL